MYAMGWESDDVKKGVQKQLFIELNEEEKIIFNHLKNISKNNLDNISLSTKFSISKAIGNERLYSPFARKAF